MKSSCKDCVMCIPNMDSHEKREFFFPDDTECGAGYPEYPDAGHMCVHYIYDDTNEYKEEVVVGRYF